MCQRGTLTLPAELREKYGIEPGDTFRLVDLDGIFVLTPMVAMVPELARETERARVEAGTQHGDTRVTVLRPGEFVLRERDRLARLTGEGEPGPDAIGSKKPSP